VRAPDKVAVDFLKGHFVAPELETASSRSPEPIQAELEKDSGKQILRFL